MHNQAEHSTQKTYTLEFPFSILNLKTNSIELLRSRLGFLSPVHFLSAKTQLAKQGLEVIRDGANIIIQTFPQDNKAC